MSNRPSNQWQHSDRFPPRGGSKAARVPSVMHMGSMKILIFLAILLAPFAFAKGEYPSRMEGVYYIWGDPIDKNDDPGVEGFSIFLEGEAAERLYKKMESQATHNECWDDGTLTKYQGNVECSLSPEEKYSCAFSVDLEDQKVYRAETC